MIGSLKNVIRIQSNKSQFKAHIFSLPELMVDGYKRLEHLGTSAKNEILSCLPLFVETVVANNDRWLIGKIQETDNPYDVFFAPERLVEKLGREAKIYTAAYVQVKSLKIYPNATLSLPEWILKLQSEIDDYCKIQRAGRSGMLHFYNEIELKNSFKVNEVMEMLKFINVSQIKSLQGVTLTSSVYTPDLEKKTLITWMIYPHLMIIGIYKDSLEKAKLVYQKPPSEKVTYKIEVGNGKMVESQFGLDFNSSQTGK